MANHRKLQNIKILHWNVCGIRNKFSEIKNLLAKHNPQLLILNECKVDFEKQKFNIQGYDKIHDSIQPHLGTTIYIKRGLRWTQLDICPGVDDADRKIEGVSVKICTDFNTGDYITIKGVYIPPNSRRQNAGEQLEEILGETNTVVIGDLNLKMRLLGHTRTEGLGRLVEELVDRGICELIHTSLPSRPLHAGNATLDIAITSGGHVTSQNSRARQLQSAASDHVPWLLNLYLPCQTEPTLRRNMKDIFGNEELRKSYCLFFENNIDPKKAIKTNAEMEACIEDTERIITEALDQYAPLREVRARELLPPKIQRLIKIRDEKKKLAHQHNSTYTRTEYNYAKHNLSKELQQYREKGWLKALHDKTENRASLWKIQKSLKKPPQRLPTLLNCNSEEDTIDRLVDKAIVTEAEINQDDQCTETTTPYQPLVKASFNEIKDAIYSFKNHKAPGPDNIRIGAIKLAGPALWNHIRKIVNYTLTTGYYPDRWKIGECIFLHKAGKNYKDPSSYRPITLLNIMGKICERIIYWRLLPQVRNMIPTHQHGFTHKRGTGTQILRTAKIITEALENNESAAMVSTDLSKAFDSINHRGLTKKMQTAGVACNYTKLVENYLSNRHTRGRFRTTRGTIKPVPHGVPQGSILGPLIFNLYVHDIPNNTAGTKLSQYADDLCIINTSSKPDFATMRAGWAADDVIEYYQRWGLRCNIEKTECIMFTKKRRYKPTVKLKCGQLLPYKKCLRYLGVLMDKTLCMKDHVNQVVKKAKQVRGMLSPIIGWYAKTDLEVKLLIIKACLLPILDYGIVQLAPRISPSNYVKIERQYRMALKTAAGLPRDLPTHILMDILDEDPWQVRVQHLHRDMLDKVRGADVEGLTDPGTPYVKQNQHNVLLPNTRLGDIPYVNKKERAKPISKRLAPGNPQ